MQCTSVKSPLGYEMNRNIRDINSEFIRLHLAGLLTEKEKRKEKGDYTVRYGITKEACFKEIDATKFLPPLHFWICALNHMESFAYHINTPAEKFINNERVMRRGKRKGKTATDHIEKVAKKDFIKEAKEGELRLLLDSPSGSGTGGSTDGANNARAFFSEKNRDKVLELFKVDDVAKDKIRRILRDINVITRVANSTQKINVPKLKEFCKEAYYFKVNAFKWPSCPTSLHRGYAHLGDIILLNDSIGLGIVSESCLGKSNVSDFY